MNFNSVSLRVHVILLITVLRGPITLAQCYPTHNHLVCSCHIYFIAPLNPISSSPTHWTAGWDERLFPSPPPSLLPLLFGGRRDPGSSDELCNCLCPAQVPSLGLSGFHTFHFICTCTFKPKKFLPQLAYKLSGAGADCVYHLHVYKLCTAHKTLLNLDVFILILKGHSWRYSSLLSK